MVKYLRSSLLLSLLLVIPGMASANIISYDLSNKNPGAEADPDYGLRLDDLFTTPTASIWTFSFDAADGGDMQMDVDTSAETVHIYGTVVGGRDIGSVWDSDTVATWEFDFFYDSLITVASDGYWEVDSSSSEDNFGTLELVSLSGTGGGYFDSSDIGSSILLADFMGGHFRPNDGPAPQGPYVSAWLKHNGDFGGTDYVRPTGGCCMDLGFRAEEVPEPASLALMALGLFGLTTITRLRRQHCRQPGN